jgi:hypothetical protein
MFPLIYGIIIIIIIIIISTSDMEKAKGEDMIKVYYMHIWKCHHETPQLVQLIYTSKNK